MVKDLRIQYGFCICAAVGNRSESGCQFQIIYTVSDSSKSGCLGDIRFAECSESEILQVFISCFQPYIVGESLYGDRITGYLDCITD